MMVEAEAGSFRDPSGQVFLKDGRIFRTVNPSTDIPQMTSKFVEIVPLVHRQGNSIPFHR